MLGPDSRRLIQSKHPVISGLCMAILIVWAGSAQSAMKIAINNLSGKPNSAVFLNFAGGSSDQSTFAATFNGGTVVPYTLEGGSSTQGIPLNTVQTDVATGLPTFNVGYWNSGRLWFSYDRSLDFSQGAPTPTGVSSTNFNTRYQFIEPTINNAPSPGTGSEIWVDETALQWFSIPLQIQINTGPGIKAQGVTNNNQTASDTQTMMAAIGSAVPANYPDPATSQTVPYANLYLPYTGAKPGLNFPSTLPNTSIVRGVDGTAGNVSAGGYTFQNPYHNWTQYLTALSSGGGLNNGSLVIQLADNFVGVSQNGALIAGNGYQPQCYDMKVIVNSGTNTVKISGNTYTGQLNTSTFPASCSGSLYIQNLQMTTTFDLLNDQTVGVYQNVTPFNWTSSTTITAVSAPNGAQSGQGGPNNMANAGNNDLLGRIMGDFLAGLSTGYPGSLFGRQNPSQIWWQNPGQAFAKAQPGHPERYNTYAASIAPYTTAYGFAYADRFGNNLLNFVNGSGASSTANQNGYLLVTIYPDAPTVIPGTPTVTSISPNQGPAAGGTPVIITGTNFSGATGASIGGNGCSNFTAVDATHVTCITPPGPLGSASVQVINAIGGNLANNLYSYTGINPAPDHNIPTIDGGTHLKLHRGEYLKVFLNQQPVAFKKVQWTTKGGGHARCVIRGISRQFFVKTTGRGAGTCSVTATVDGITSEPLVINIR
jgi:hypothetical protein